MKPVSRSSGAVRPVRTDRMPAVDLGGVDLPELQD